MIQNVLSCVMKTEQSTGQKPAFTAHEEQNLY